MLLQQIVEKLDAELDRLGQLRTILLSIHRPATDGDDVVLAPLRENAVLSMDTEQPEVTETPEAIAPRAAGGVAGMPRQRAARRTKPEENALRGPVSASPVVVQAAMVAKEHAARKTQRAQKQEAPPPAPGSLGSMIRALRLDNAS